jgi:uncharacterized protein YkwD
MALAGAMLACGVALGLPVGAEAHGKELGRGMLEQVNEERARHGLAALRGSPSLHHSAGAYARWMLRTEYFGHLGRIRASGRFSMLGENLAWHSGRSPRTGWTVERWMQSPPHRALMLHPDFRWLGAGAAVGSLEGQTVTAWVLHMGGPRLAGAAALGGQLPSEPRILSAPAEIVSTTSPAGASIASAAP